MEREKLQSKTRERAAQAVNVYTEVYERERTYVRGVGSMRYSLAKERQQRLEGIQRVFTPALDPEAHSIENWKIIDPGDEVFKTQTMQWHFVTINPNSRNDGHGHQNEALFYVLQGRGYELHDGQRYDWGVGDAVAVHNDCVHWHNNPDDREQAVCIVVKPKPLSLFMGLTYQGKVGTTPEDDDRWEAPSPWLTARPEGDEQIPKVLKPADTPWVWTQFGRVRQLSGDGVPLRIKATDAYLHEIPAQSRSGKRWQMADEAVYVLEGEGYDLHWDVEADITDQYYARIAKEPTRWDWKKGDVVWVPQNTVVQRFSADGTSVLLGATNRIYQTLGYSRVVYFEDAPEYQG